MSAKRSKSKTGLISVVLLVALLVPEAGAQTAHDYFKKMVNSADGLNRVFEDGYACFPTSDVFGKQPGADRTDLYMVEYPWKLSESLARTEPEKSKASKEAADVLWEKLLTGELKIPDDEAKKLIASKFVLLAVYDRGINDGSFMLMEKTDDNQSDGVCREISDDSGRCAFTAPGAVGRFNDRLDAIDAIAGSGGKISSRMRLDINWSTLSFKLALQGYMQTEDKWDDLALDEDYGKCEAVPPSADQRAGEKVPQN